MKRKWKRLILKKKSADGNKCMRITKYANLKSGTKHVFVDNKMPFCKKRPKLI